MAFTTPTYTPSDGLKNTTSFPSAPASETAARTQFQDMFDQALNIVKALITALESVTTGSSGAENIGSAAIESVTGTTVRAQLVDLKAQIDAIIAGSVTDGSITTSKLAADAVDGTKIADDAIASEHIADNAVQTAHIVDGAVTAGKLGATSIAESNIATGAVTEGKIGALAVTEGKIGTGAVTQTKIQDNAISTAKLQDNAITAAKLASDALSTEVLLWTGTWAPNTGITITNVGQYNRLLIKFSSFYSVIVVKTPNGHYRGANCGIFNNLLELIHITQTPTDTLVLSGHKSISLYNDAHPIIDDIELSATSVYGLR